VYQPVFAHCSYFTPPVLHDEFRRKLLHDIAPIRRVVPASPAFALNIDRLLGSLVRRINERLWDRVLIKRFDSVFHGFTPRTIT
jgi:hypothetical protein